MNSSLLGSTVGLGRLNLPLWALLLFGSYVAGLVAIRIVLRKNREIRSEVGDRLSTGFIVAFLVWKFSPVIANPGIVVKQPLYLLYAAGGSVATFLALVAATGYLAFSTRKWWKGDAGDRRERIRGSVSFLGTAGIVFLVGMVAFAAIPSGSAGSHDSDVKTAPGFSLVTLDGKEVSLADYRGKTVVLNFWATWCPPCRAEIPLFVAFSNDVGDDGPVMLSVNQTASEHSLQALQDFTAKAKIDYPVLLDPDNRVFLAYGVRGIPVTVVIGPDGEFLDRRTGVVTRSWLEKFR